MFGKHGDQCTRCFMEISNHIENGSMSQIALVGICGKCKNLRYHTQPDQCQ